MSVITKSINRLIRPLGYRINVSAVGRDAPPPPRPVFPKDFRDDEIETCEAVRPYTMTSRERVVSLVRAVRYVVGNGVEGDFVECGVWRGGSMMAVARTLLALGETGRDLHLFDTFEGMPAPTELDFKTNEAHGVTSRKWRESQRGGHNDWCYASLEDVRSAVLGTGYPAERIHFVKGKVEDTLPGRAPRKIALLRLDTDFYESTRHEMLHLYPRLVAGGLFISDDYNTWEGARRAVDEYLAGRKIPLFLGRIDASGVMGVKPDAAVAHLTAPPPVACEAVV